jgi:hypothetical protein
MAPYSPRHSASSPLPPLRSARLLDQLRERIRYDHYSLRTEQSYVHWVRRFVHFHGLRHPKEMGGAEVEAFLAYPGLASPLDSLRCAEPISSYVH